MNLCTPKFSLYKGPILNECYRGYIIFSSIAAYIKLTRLLGKYVWLIWKYDFMSCFRRFSILLSKSKRISEESGEIFWGCLELAISPSSARTFLIVLTEAWGWLDFVSLKMSTAVVLRSSKTASTIFSSWAVVKIWDLSDFDKLSMLFVCSNLSLILVIVPMIYDDRIFPGFSQ